MSDDAQFNNLVQVAKPQALSVDMDAPLVRQVQLGNQKAFEMLVVKYRRRIERLIARMVRDMDLVEDIAQETFIKAYRALPNFRGESAFYTWLYRIAVNTAKKSLMQMYRDPVMLASTAQASGDDEDDDKFAMDAHITDGETPESVLASRQIADAVNRAVDGLSPELRQAITLREIDGMSYDGIAQLMNCPIGTVRSRISRARDTISKQIKPLLDARDGKRW